MDPDGIMTYDITLLWHACMMAHMSSFGIVLDASILVLVWLLVL